MTRPPPPSTPAPGPTAPAGPRSKDAHLPLHVRILCPDGGALPPLFTPAVDERLYTLVALALRAYVLSWYPRFTRDRTLVPALSTLVLSALVPLLAVLPAAAPRLILFDVPALLAAHIRAVRAAERAVDVGLYASMAEAYHALMPVRGVVLLPVPVADAPLPPPSPSPSLQPAEPAHGLAASAVASPAPAAPATPAASANTDDLAAQLADAASDVRPPPTLRPAPPPPGPAEPTEPAEPLEPAEPAAPPPRTHAYALDPAYYTALAHAVLSANLGAADARSAAQTAMAREVLGRAVLCGVGRRLAQPWFWWMLLLKLVPPVPERDAAGRVPPTSATSPTAARPAERARRAGGTLARAARRLWAAALVLWSALAYALACPPTPHTAVLDPWLALLRAALAPVPAPAPAPPLMRAALGLADAAAALAGPVADRVLPAALDRALSERTATAALAVLERAAFPEGHPAPSVPDPTPAEAAAMRAAALERLAGRVPRPLAALLPEPARGAGEERAAALLDWLDDPECNAHLVAMLYNAAFAALVPALVAAPGGAKA